MQESKTKVPRGKKSAVLRVRRLAGKRLTFMLRAEDDTLREFAEDSKTGRAGKTLVKEGPLADYTGGSEKRHCASPAPCRRPDQYPDYSRLSEAHDREGRHGCSGREPHSLGPGCRARGKGAG